MYNFDTLKTLGSLLLARSHTDKINSQLTQTFITYMYNTLCCCDKVITVFCFKVIFVCTKQMLSRKANVIRKIRREKTHLQNHTVFIKKNSHISGPV